MWWQPVFLFIEILRALKDAENHTFEKLTKLAKLQYFEPFYFLKWKKELTEIYLTVHVSLLYYIHLK